MKYRYRPGTTPVLTEKVVPLKLEVVQETVQRMDTAWATVFAQNTQQHYETTGIQLHLNCLNIRHETSLNFVPGSYFAALWFCVRGSFSVTRGVDFQWKKKYLGKNQLFYLFGWLFSQQLKCDDFLYVVSSLNNQMCNIVSDLSP